MPTSTLLHCEPSHYLWISISISSLATILTIISSVCVTLNANLHHSIRGILISLYVSNLVGIAAITHDSVLTFCNVPVEVPLVRVPLLLSISHLFLLTLAEYAGLTAGKKQRYDFTGLTLLAWILSVIMGVILIAPHRHGSEFNGRKIFSLVVLILCVGLVAALFLVLWKYRRMLKLATKVEKDYFFKACSWIPQRRSLTDPEMRLVLLGGNAIWFVCCSLLWLVNEFHQEKRLDSLVIVLVSCNFFAPCSIAIFLGCRAEKRRRIVMPF